MTCDLLVDVDGACGTCGAPTAYYNGELQHRRGRKPGSHNAPAPRRFDPTERVRCPDCDAQMQEARFTAAVYWRCPWTIDVGDGGLSTVIHDMLARCGWPRGQGARPREQNAPYPGPNPANSQRVA